MAAKKEKKTRKPTTAAKKVTPRVDVVEEAKKELKKIEASQKKPTENKPFPWGVFFGAVLLTCAVFLIGFKVNDMMTVSNLEKKLPDIIAPLGGGMAVETIGKPKNVSGIYQFTIKFADFDNEFTSSITRDGKLFFVEAINVDELLGQATDPAAAAATGATCETLEKTENPKLSIYVSSDCGYCKQAELEIASAITQVPSLQDSIMLRYAGSVAEDGSIISFLGSPEAGTENLRQVCIRDEQPTTFWSYVECMAGGGTADSCISSAGVNAANLTACMEDETRGKAAITADIDQANTHAVDGTPSFFVNESQKVSDIDFGGRVPDAYKQIVCCASSTQPDYCTQTITQTVE